MAIKEKHKAWKARKFGGSRETYNLPKARAKKAVAKAKDAAEKEKFAKVGTNSNEIFKLARQMKSENMDVVGDKCIYNDDGKFCISVEDKKKAWEQHYRRLCNEEFPWNIEDLPPAPAVQGPVNLISVEAVTSAVRKLNIGKAAGPSGVTAELVKASGSAGIVEMHRLINQNI